MKVHSFDPPQIENLGVLGGENGVRFWLHKSLNKEKVKSPKLTNFGQKFKVLTSPKIENIRVLGGKVVLDFDLGINTQKTDIRLSNLISVTSIPSLICPDLLFFYKNNFSGGIDICPDSLFCYKNNYSGGIGICPDSLFFYKNNYSGQMPIPPEKLFL